MKVLDIKINVALAALVVLIQSSCARDFKTSKTRHFSFRLGHIRSLQEIWDCTTPPERVDFFEAALGPFYDSRRDLSVFLELTDDFYGDFITIPLVELAEAFSYSIFPFVQEEETFGHNGEYTAELLNQHQLFREFWEYDEEGLPPVLLDGIHSEILSDTNSMVEAIRTYVSLEGLDEMGQITNRQYRLAAAEAQQMILDLPGNYSNPLLSYTAWAYSNGKVKGFPKSPLIVLGDGYMDFLAPLVQAAVANDIMHAHEFAHVVQFITGLRDAGGDEQQFHDDFFYEATPEKTREIELAADAYASYFLAHEKGRNFQIPLLLQAAGGFFLIGDCYFDSDHHGTPEQRECASLWGAQLALSSAPGEDPITFREFKFRFEENIQSILDDDYSVCVMDELFETTAAVTSAPSTVGTISLTPVSAAPTHSVSATPPPSPAVSGTPAPSPAMSGTLAPSPGSSISEPPSSPSLTTAFPTSPPGVTPAPSPVSSVSEPPSSPTPTTASPTSPPGGTPAPSPVSSVSEPPSSPSPTTASPTSPTATPRPTTSGSSMCSAGLGAIFASIGVATSMMM